MLRLLTGIVLILVALALLYWVGVTWGFDYYSKNGPCGTERVRAAKEKIERVGDEMNLLAQIWDNNPSSSTRGEMVTDLLLLTDEAEHIEVPLCMQGIKTHLVEGLNSLTISWKAFARDAYLPGIYDGYDGAVTNFYMAQQEMLEIEQCMPYCETVMLGQLFP